MISRRPGPEGRTLVPPRTPGPLGRLDAADPDGERIVLVDRGFPYVCSPMARGTIPDDHPHFANGARGEALKHADAILMLGGRIVRTSGLREVR